MNLLSSARAKRAALLLAVSILGAPLLVPALALAHEGHDHGAPAVAVNASAQAPRFVAASEDFEVVGVLLDRRLTLYLDDARSNAPIDGATLEVAAETFKGMAVRDSAGTYVLSLNVAPAVGKHALTISVDAPAGSDLLVATLDVAAADPTAAGRGTTDWLFAARWLLGGAAILLGSAAAFVYVRRRRTPPDAGRSA